MLSADRDQSSSRRVANVEKDIRKGLKQLAGAMRNIRSRAPISTHEDGTPITLSDRETSPAHAILVLSEMYFGIDWKAVVGLVAEDHCDIAIGSRLAKDSATKRSLGREITSRGYVLLIRAFNPRLKITDAQCGFKALNRKAVDAVVPKIANRMWFFDTEMLILAQREKLRIRELPVKWIEDTDSKVNVLRTAFEDIQGLVRMRFGSGRSV